MSIIKVNPDDIERYTLLANPRRTFISASSNASHVISPGITGTLPLFPDGTSKMKDVHHRVTSDPADDSSLAMALPLLHTLIKDDHYTSDQSYYGLEWYMDQVNSASSTPMFQKRQSVIRFEPGAARINSLDKDFERKRVIQEILFPYYRHQYPSLQWSYTNYHSLNFVTCSYLPAGSALIYPAGTGTVALEDVNFYAPSASFTFDFYINPRYAEERPGDEFTAGTIFHMSSSYAISLVTGTSYAFDGKHDGFRILLQLSQSAEIPPSSVAISGDTVTAPDSTADPGFLFVSPDNSLKRNTWHHVAIRWGGPEVRNGTGSFVIDGAEGPTFAFSSASVMAPIQTAPNQNDADALFIGNFYEGSNYSDKPIAGFFNSDASTEFGIVDFSPGGGLSDPDDYQLRHTLNAEVHDLKIFNAYRSDEQIYSSSIRGFGFDPYYNRPGVTGSNPYLSGATANEGLLFYVPPFFTKKSPTRYVNQTPFFYATGSSEDPFNVAMSFGIGGHELNLPNFTREFVRGFYPRPLGFEATRVNETTSTPRTANYFMYESASNRRRNIAVLPCDNGRFIPNFNMLLTGSLVSATSGSDLDRFKNDFGVLDLSRIDLNSMVGTGSILKATDLSALGLQTGSIFGVIEGATPEDPAVPPGSILTILQRTGDPSSNEVVLFDVSNMFYGDRIKPKSVELKDLAVTGTAGRVQITLRDDGHGNLYRGDSSGSNATWASVGNVLYEEGLLVIKSPNIPLFGSDAWQLTFEGERKVHVLEVNISADKGFINSSSNPTFRKLVPTDSPSETASEFVYLTGLQLHDENLNVIGRSNLAQPIVKRDGDRYNIRLRMDF